MNALILLVAHAPLAHALRECALHIFPDCDEALRVLDVPPDAEPEVSLESARVLVADATERPLLVLTDLFGATPCNVAQRLVEGRSGARLVTGINLPMLLRAVSYRAEALDLLVQRAVVGGTQGVMQVAAPATRKTLRKTHDQDPHNH